MSQTRMTAIARGEGNWFIPAGPDADLVLSSRARLARNLGGVRFSSRATERDLQGVLSDAIAAARGCEALRADDALVIAELERVDRELLLERHLISAEFSEPQKSRVLIPGITDTLGVMVNEEDHLRIQGLRAGFQLYECWEDASRVDAALGKRLDYAFREDFGFLTACPSNVGTGLRTSVLLHLPALVLSQEIRRVIEEISQVGLTVRGFYGEGSDVVGNFFQISNQITLGKSEEDLVEMLDKVTRDVMQREVRAREWLWTEARTQITDKVYRAMGTIQNCRLVSSDEVVAAASALRLGVSLGLDDMPSLEVLNRLVVLSQPAHVQRLTGCALGTPDRSEARAELVRRVLRGESPTNGAI